MDETGCMPRHGPQPVHASPRRKHQNKTSESDLQRLCSFATMPKLRIRTRPAIRHPRHLRRLDSTRTIRTATRSRTHSPTILRHHPTTGHEMVNPQKRKGDAAERELAKQLSDLLGFTVRRKLGAGRQDDEGDLDGLPDCTAQAKNYSDVLRAINTGLKDLEQQQSNSGDTHAVLFVRRRGGQWIAIQTLEQWSTTFRETL